MRKDGTLAELIRLSILHRFFMLSSDAIYDKKIVVYRHEGSVILAVIA